MGESQTVGIMRPIPALKITLVYVSTVAVAVNLHVGKGDSKPALKITFIYVSTVAVEGKLNLVNGISIPALKITFINVSTVAVSVNQFQMITLRLALKRAIPVASVAAVVSQNLCVIQFLPLLALEIATPVASKVATKENCHTKK